MYIQGSPQAFGLAPHALEQQDIISENKRLLGHVNKYEAQLLTSNKQPKMKICHLEFQKYRIEFKFYLPGYIHGLKPLFNTIYSKQSFNFKI